MQDHWRQGGGLKGCVNDPCGHWWEFRDSKKKRKELKSKGTSIV